MAAWQGRFAHLGTTKEFMNLVCHVPSDAPASAAAAAVKSPSSPTTSSAPAAAAVATEHAELEIWHKEYKLVV